ncbi:MAG: hypothetical protein IKX00_01440 [Bacilli bacterium]|nr:hypothetical protein [Bacilli bacterium]
MKKLFEKHTIAKIVGITIFVTIVLTWILNIGAFQGTEYLEYGKNRLGFNDIPSIVYNSIYFAIDKIIYLFVLGGFYAVLSKTNGYNKIVSNIAKKIKGKEHIFAVVVAVVIAALTSITTSTFAMILFIPMLITIMLNAGLNKLTAFASTFGALLVGVLGATLGTDALLNFDAYFSQSLAETGADASLKYRIIIAFISVALYSFFLFFTAKKAMNNKKKEEIAEEFKIVEAGKKEKVKTLPIIITLSILAVITLLGFLNWSGTFKIEIFNDFHEWLTGIKVGKDFNIVSSLLGTNAVSFGAFDLFTISTIILIFTVLIAVLYSIKFDDLIETFGQGIVRIIKPVGSLVAVYCVFIIVYMSPIVPTMVKSIMHKDGIPDINIDYNGSAYAFFNIDSDDDGKADYNLINQDKDKDGKCDINCDTNKDGYPDKNLDFNADGVVDDNDAAILEQIGDGTSTNNFDVDGDGIADVNLDTDFSLPRTIIASTLTNIFHVDAGYTGYAIGAYLVSGFGSASLALVFLVFFAIYGLLQFFIPTSILLMLGLTYAKVEYKDWMKFIWRFILGMLCVLLIIFIFMAL